MTDSMRDRMARHESLTVQEGPGDMVLIKAAELKELMLLAHEAVHPSAVDDEAAMSAAREQYTHDLFGPPEDPDENPSVELGYDELQLRLQCLHLATQVDMSRISAHAHHGNTWNSDPVGLAEAYLAFLQGASNAPR